MLFEKLSFQEQNYGMKGIQLATSGRLNSLDKILLVVLFLLIIVVLYMFFVCKKAYKLEKKNGKNVAKIKEELENTVSERDVLMGEYKALLDKYNIISVPTLVKIDGDKIDIRHGILSVEELNKWAQTSI